ncbi:WD40-repeat-containing domain [Pseudocohnilembus persalinus]|uniref:WD40-repeat-containing domain n=1 Tax=Pseudocohnilembus persalinus TaxID=266149 RepID=A0A0V0QMW9_PSEPJ|nr:WD40-repeat-containing domain [Pseudocohnilembus persalinus]|eukprot:KRX03495.1 WD40-repeat-containing domain [Pseudocohnilembus persalinus]
MSIVIKSQELNYAIYKYLLEAGLQHTAFSLFNEAHIEEKVREFDQNCRPGHLLHLVERGLMFNQIESHIHLGQYCECKKEMHIITPHQCEITEKELQKKRKLENYKDTFLHDAIQRTDNLINNIVANENTNTIVLEYKQFQNITRQLEVEYGENELQNVKFSVNKRHKLLSVYDPKLGSVQNVKYGMEYVNNCHTFSPLQVVNILPCSMGDSILKLKFMEWDRVTGNYLILVFEEGHVIMYKQNEQKIKKYFKINNCNDLINISWCPQFNNILALHFSSCIQFIDPESKNVFGSIQGKFKQFSWRYFDQFMTVDYDGNIKFGALEDENFDITLINQGKIENVKFNKAKNLVAGIDKDKNNVKVWVLDKNNKQQDYLIEVGDSDYDKIQDYFWCTGNNIGIGNFIAIVYKREIKIYDLELVSQKYVSYFPEEQLNIANQLLNIKILAKFYFSNNFYSIQSAYEIDGLQSSIIVVFSQNQLMFIDVGNQYKNSMNLEQKLNYTCYCNRCGDIGTKQFKNQNLQIGILNHKTQKRKYMPAVQKWLKFSILAVFKQILNQIQKQVEEQSILIQKQNQSLDQSSQKLSLSQVWNYSQQNQNNQSTDQQRTSKQLSPNDINFQQELKQQPSNLLKFIIDQVTKTINVGNMQGDKKTIQIQQQLMLYQMIKKRTSQLVINMNSQTNLAQTVKDQDENWENKNGQEMNSQSNFQESQNQITDQSTNNDRSSRSYKHFNTQMMQNFTQYQNLLKKTQSTKKKKIYLNKSKNSFACQQVYKYNPKYKTYIDEKCSQLNENDFSLQTFQTQQQQGSNLESIQIKQEKQDHVQENQKQKIIFRKNMQAQLKNLKLKDKTVVVRNQSQKNTYSENQRIPFQQSQSQYSDNLPQYQFISERNSVQSKGQKSIMLKNKYKQIRIQGRNHLSLEKLTTYDQSLRSNISQIKKFQQFNYIQIKQQTKGQFSTQSGSIMEQRNRNSVKNSFQLNQWDDLQKEIQCEKMNSLLQKQVRIYQNDLSHMKKIQFQQLCQNTILPIQLPNSKAQKVRTFYQNINQQKINCDSENNNINNKSGNKLQKNNPNAISSILINNFSIRKGQTNKKQTIQYQIPLSSRQHPQTSQTSKRDSQKLNYQINGRNSELKTYSVKNSPKKDQQEISIQ